MIFGDDAAYINYDPDDSVLTIAENMMCNNRDEESTHVGHGTNFNAIFHKLNKSYNRVIILSDMQGWMDGGAPTATFADYKRKFSVNPFIYSIDLAGYGTMMFPESKVFCLAGFSEKIFDMMKMLEQDRNALVNRINAVEL